jgi:hypothetical protein
MGAGGDTGGGGEAERRRGEEEEEGTEGTEAMEGTADMEVMARLVSARMEADQTAMGDATELWGRRAQVKSGTVLGGDRAGLNGMAVNAGCPK